MRLDLAQFRELAAFAAFGSDLDEATQRQLARGERLVELLKQAQYSPLEVTEQVISIYAATKGHFDTIPVDKIQTAETDLIEFVRSRHSDAYDALESEKALSDNVVGKLDSAISSFLQANNY